MLVYTRLSSDGPSPVHSAPTRRAKSSAASENAPACARTLPCPSRAPAALCATVSQWVQPGRAQKLIDSPGWVPHKGQSMGQWGAPEEGLRHPLPNRLLPQWAGVPQRGARGLWGLLLALPLCCECGCLAGRAWLPGLSLKC